MIDFSNVSQTAYELPRERRPQSLARRTQMGAGYEAEVLFTEAPSAYGDDVGVPERIESTFESKVALPDNVAKALEGTFPVTGRLRTSQGPSVIRFPKARAPETRFELLQQWEGVVQEANDEDIYVVLRDLTDPSHTEEEATIGLEEVSPDDLPLVQPGSVFYWSIGYETSRLGQVKRVSTVRFRRLPSWSKREVQRIEKRADELMAIFGVMDDEGTAKVG